MYVHVQAEDESKDKKILVDMAMQSVYFAAFWTWIVCVTMFVALVLLFTTHPQSVLANPVMAARISLLCFLAIFLLQIPVRFQRLTFSQHQQFLLFHVLEFCARCSVMVIMWYYLFT